MKQKTIIIVVIIIVIGILLVGVMTGNILSYGRHTVCHCDLGKCDCKVYDSNKKLIKEYSYNV